MWCPWRLTTWVLFLIWGLWGWNQISNGGTLRFRVEIETNIHPIFLALTVRNTVIQAKVDLRCSLWTRPCWLLYHNGCNSLQSLIAMSCRTLRQPSYSWGQKLREHNTQHVACFLHGTTIAGFAISRRGETRCFCCCRMTLFGRPEVEHRRTRVGPNKYSELKQTHLSTTLNHAERDSLLQTHLAICADW